MKLVFFISFFVLFYSYFGYVVLIFILVKIKFLFNNKASPSSSLEFFPTLSLIVPAYNEQFILKSKIENCLQLDYPRSKLEIIFIIDGSTDKSSIIIQSFKEIKLLNEGIRKGKSFAINRAVEHTQAEILVFSDANTILNKEALLEMVKLYSNPKVGGVAGEKKVMNKGFKETEIGEGIYWQYESLLKKLDSDLYSTIGAAGELFSLRKELFEPIAENVILDDFILSLKINLKGYKVSYSKKAYAMELPSQNLKEELKRKIRISAGAFQAMGMLFPIFNIFKYHILTFQYFSHRVLRWTLCPVAIPLLFIANLFLLKSPIFFLCFFLQICFYLSVILGYWNRKGKKTGVFYSCFYFLFMNYCVIMGFLRFIKNNQSYVWERVQRIQ